MTYGMLNWLKALLDGALDPWSCFFCKDPCGQFRSTSMQNLEFKNFFRGSLKLNFFAGTCGQSRFTSIQNLESVAQKMAKLWPFP